MERITLDRSGTQLALVDFGGEGRPVLLLHGLAGHAEEWTETAGWLRETHHVFALDLRGHGRSERMPEDVSLAAQVSDVVSAIERIGESAVLVGHSVSGIVAIVVAGNHPALVTALVVSDASPAGASTASVVTTVEDLEKSLSSWPVPFASRGNAIDFFGGPSLSASAWADGLEERPDGLWPRFDIEIMKRFLHDAIAESRWNVWERITCPTLVVRAGNGLLNKDEAEAMIELHPRARFIEIPDAKHDLHLDSPEAWRKALTAFLKSN
jgi:pimeloyl-ACP methyl ester carboxylesterase